MLDGKKTVENKIKKPIYLDWNATTPPLDDVISAIHKAYLKAWANPASVHWHGREAKKVVEDARQRVAELAGVDARDVFFTSGATEANNLALRTVFQNRSGPKKTLVLSEIEHPSVVEVAKTLEREGLAKIDWLEVDHAGRVLEESIYASLKRGDVALLSLQFVNHETGVIQPVGEALKACHEHGVKVHSDMVQSFGKLQDTWDGVDYRSMASHKMRGPKGVGALIVRHGAPLEPLLRGGSQERGLRPGTLDVGLISGFGVAANYAKEGPKRYVQLKELRDSMENLLLSYIPKLHIVGKHVLRVPHVSNLLVPNWNAPELVAALDLEGISVSGGSACSSGSVEVSPVISRIVGKELAKTAIRISMGDDTTEEHLSSFVESLLKVVRRVF